jgi:PST family polysaccharide transporter
LLNVLIATTGYTICALASFFAALLPPSGDFPLRIVVGALAMLVALAMVCLCWPAFRRDFRAAAGVIRLMLPGRRAAGSLPSPRDPVKK